MPLPRFPRPPSTRSGVVLVVAGIVGLGALLGGTDEPEPLATSHEPASTAVRTPSTPLPATTKPMPTPTSASTPAANPSPTPSTNERQQRALSELDELAVTERINPRNIYRRSEFGSGWSDTDHNGCNQRDDVLLRDAVPGTVTTGWQGRCSHDVLAGTWIDPYTGRTIVLTDAKERSQSMAVQIDHVVPLSEAWVSGADAWTRDRRRLFANDLVNLLAVDGPTNQSKSDHDPAAWRPRKAYQCSYAERWIDVKTRWDLSADASELRALREMLGYC